MSQTFTSHRLNSRLAGAFFILVMFAYATGDQLLGSAKHVFDATGQVPTLQTAFGALLIWLNCAGVVAIGALLMPVFREKNPALAYTYFAARIMEGILLLVGAVFLLLRISLMELFAPTDPDSIKLFSELLLRGNFYAFQLSMITLGVASVAVFGWLLRTGLLPRWVAAAGVAGYALLLGGAVAELFGQKIGVLLSIPGGLFELFFGGWLIAKGFRMDG